MRATANIFSNVEMELMRMCTLHSKNGNRIKMNDKLLRNLMKVND